MGLRPSLGAQAFHLGRRLRCRRPETPVRSGRRLRCQRAGDSGLEGRCRSLRGVSGHSPNGVQGLAQVVFASSSEGTGDSGDGERRLRS